MEVIIDLLGIIFVVAAQTAALEALHRNRRAQRDAEERAFVADLLAGRR